LHACEVASATQSKINIYEVQTRKLQERVKKKAEDRILLAGNAGGLKEQEQMLLGWGMRIWKGAVLKVVAKKKEFCATQIQRICRGHLTRNPKGPSKMHAAALLSETEDARVQ